MRSALPLAPKKLPMPLWRVAPAVSDAADGKASACAFGPVAVATDPRRFLEAQLGLGLSVAQLNVTASEVRCVARFEGDGLDAVEVAVSDSARAAMLSVTVEAAAAGPCRAPPPPPRRPACAGASARGGGRPPARDAPRTCGRGATPATSASSSRRSRRAASCASTPAPTARRSTSTPGTTKRRPASSWRFGDDAMAAPVGGVRAALGALPPRGPAVAPDGERGLGDHGRRRARALRRRPLRREPGSVVDAALAIATATAGKLAVVHDERSAAFYALGHARARPGSVAAVLTTMAVRGVDRFGVSDGGDANRGLAGIDGVLSTALGYAENSGGALLLIGDQALLHDAGALRAVADAKRLRGARLQTVVTNNDGGGIFSFLPLATNAPGLPADEVVDEETEFEPIQRRAAAAAARARPRARVVGGADDRGAADLHYEFSAGASSEPPVLLLHGLFGRRRASRLAPPRDVIAVDLPGHGRSGPSLAHHAAGFEPLVRRVVALSARLAASRATRARRRGARGRAARDRPLDGDQSWRGFFDDWYAGDAKAGMWRGLRADGDAYGALLARRLAPRPLKGFAASLRHGGSAIRPR
ncbi:hypothetical protein JL721_5748 [Aureococcus anophagefferens]|nr:hypothetical protein JL721_5748 [Aureococcus anophagefferens]